MDQPHSFTQGCSSTLLVTSRRKRGSSTEVWIISLSDGTSFFVINPQLDSIKEGSYLTEEQLELVQEDDQFIRARDWSAGYLAKREQSAKGLLIKLAQKEFSKKVSIRVLETMQTLGFQDDRRFAEAWLNDRIRFKQESRLSLTQGLLKKGVSSSLISELLDENYDKNLEYENLKKFIDKIIRVKNPDKKTIIKKAQAKGFSYNQILNYLKEDQ